jgi:Tol biopolymer transport system component
MARVDTLLVREGEVLPQSWSPDGSELYLSEWGPEGIRLGRMRLGDSRSEEPAWLFPDSSATGGPVVSPDGSWLLYGTSASGYSEICVARRSDPGVRHQLSLGGGFGPRWQADGGEVFYLNGHNELMAVAVDLESGTFGRPERLFGLATLGSTGGERTFAVDPTGERFLFVLPLEAHSLAPITVVSNWRPATPGD